jgi:hypothetical protein
LYTQVFSSGCVALANLWYTVSIDKIILNTESEIM